MAKGQEAQKNRMTLHSILKDSKAGIMILNPLLGARELTVKFLCPLNVGFLE